MLENEFSGNLVEVCPTGVFTDKTLRWHYTRKWDLQYAPSICVHCGLGCNISPGERYGTLRRIVNRYNHEVNGYFLCDRGRFGYEFVNSPARIRTAAGARPGGDRAGGLREVPRNCCSGAAAPSGSARRAPRSRPISRCASWWARTASTWAWRTSNTGCVSVMLEAMRAGPRTPSLREMEHSDAVLVLGEDVLNTAPRMALALRQSVRQQPMRQAEKLHIPLWMDAGVREAGGQARGPLFIATPAAPDSTTSPRAHCAPRRTISRGWGSPWRARSTPRRRAWPASTRTRRTWPASSPRRSAPRTGRWWWPGRASASEAILHAAAAVARALARGKRGAGLHRARAQHARPRHDGRPPARRGAPSGGAETVIVLENDLYRRAPAAAVDAFLSRARNVIALDSLANPTTAKAELALPAGTFAESDGTFVSNEGRAQRFFQVFVPEGDIQESWRWLAHAPELGGRPGRR